MRALEMIRNQAATDAKLVARDRFLTGVFAFIVALAVMLRFGIPLISNSIRESQGFDLEPYFVLVSSFVTLSIAAPLIGIVIGFILLEARENRTLQALMVSPISLGSYLLYRVSTPILLGAVLAPLVGVIVGVGLPSLPALIAISLVGSILGGIATLFIATFSDNKVQAFAMMKFFSAAGLIPFAAFFLREPWQYVAGIYPPYWAFKAYWVAADSGAGWWIYLLIASATLLATLWMMSWRFQTIAYRG